MPYKALLLVVFTVVLSGCASFWERVGLKDDLSDPKDCPKEVLDSKFLTIGQVEYVDILPQGLRKKARIDTGAQTTSIDAADVVSFERDGKRWVRFNVVDRVTSKSTEFKLPVERVVMIKRHGAEDSRRWVVMLKLSIGGIIENVEVTLADRKKFEYPVLIGRNFLDSRAVVDVSRKYITLEQP